MKQTTLEAWLEWRTLCSLAHQDCSDHTRRTLTEWGCPQIANRLRKRDPNHEFLKPANLCGEGDESWRNDLWHLLETQMHATSGKTGKRWKDWLFEKAAENPSPLTALEKLATSLIRTAVNRFAADETVEPGVKVTSLDAPADGESQRRTLAEMLIEPEIDEDSPDKIAIGRELDRIADLEANLFLSRLIPRERLALAVREAGLGVKDPRAHRLLGCGQTQLSAAQVKALRAFCEHLRKTWISKSQLDMLDMAGRAVSQLKKLCLASLTPEESRTLGL